MGLLTNPLPRCPRRPAGLAGLPQLSDTFVSDPRRHYREGQSVRAQVRPGLIGCQPPAAGIASVACCKSDADALLETICELTCCHLAVAVLRSILIESHSMRSVDELHR